jgi:hypothetical protein
MELPEVRNAFLSAPTQHLRRLTQMESSMWR